ncbi:MAG: DUF3795 domain-containing protein [Candidatus Coatesbacteria bacterium]|nr:DUF3795 domain-containing protein [Candidatus Coatesbacteria bacterium]
MLEHGGCCGLECAECPAFIATRSGDRAAFAEVARQWSELYQTEIDAADLPCDGCLARPPQPLGCHAPECEIRACAIDRGFKTCAECAELPCGLISGLLEQVPEARRRLENLRG